MFPHRGGTWRHEARAEVQQMTSQLEQLRSVHRNRRWAVRSLSGEKSLGEATYNVPTRLLSLIATRIEENAALRSTIQGTT